MDKILPYIIGYIIGYILSIIFLTKYGKKIGLGDYDKPKTYVDYDDWSSNAKAWTWFSIVWPIFYAVLSCVCLINGLTLITKKIKNVIDEKV